MSVTFQALTTAKRVPGPQGPHPEVLALPASLHTTFSNANARAVLGFLGLLHVGEALEGACALERFVAALDVGEALATPHATAYTRETVVEGCYVSYGLDVQGVLQRVRRLRAFAQAAQARGATHITWG